MDSKNLLNSYRIMWMMVMFDLPVITVSERKAANQFRLKLLSMGFMRCQLSVYMRFCTSAEQVQTYCKRVESVLPREGQVNIIQLTDKQYERIISFRCGMTQPSQKTPEQFDVFD